MLTTNFRGEVLVKSNYIHHSVTLKNQSSISRTVTFTLAYVQWMEYHHQNSLYGISATVCADSTKEPCAVSPCTEILAKCAVCRTKINDENVFVAYIFALLAPTALYSLQDRVTSMNHNISWLHRVLPMSFNIFTSQWLLY